MIVCVCKEEVIPGEEMKICKGNEGGKSFLLVDKMLVFWKDDHGYLAA